MYIRTGADHHFNPVGFYAGTGKLKLEKPGSYGFRYIVGKSSLLIQIFAINNVNLRTNETNDLKGCLEHTATR